MPPPRRNPTPAAAVSPGDMHHVPSNKRPVIVTMSLPADWPRALAECIPAQREMVNRLLAEGVVQSYSVAADRATVWLVLVVDDSPAAVDVVMSAFPIIDFADYTWEPLLLTNDSSSVMHYSLN